MQTINPSTCSINSASHPPEDAKKYTATSSSLRSVNITEDIRTGPERYSRCRRCLCCRTPRLLERKRHSVSVATHLCTDIKEQDDVSVQPPAKSQKSQEKVLESESHESNSSFPTKSQVVGFDSESEEIVKNIAAKMSEEMSTRIPLPEGWVVTIDDIESSQVMGSIIDNSGMPRISYLKKIFANDSVLIPRILSYDEAREEKSEKAAVAQCDTADTDAADALSNLMGEQIFEDLNASVRVLHTPNLYLHPERNLREHINPILDWYNREDNSRSIEQFLLNSKFKGTLAAIALNQFIEMFVIDDDLSLVAEICRECAAKGFQSPDAVYNRWKALKSTEAD